MDVQRGVSVVLADLEGRLDPRRRAWGAVERRIQAPQRRRPVARRNVQSNPLLEQ
jgi:hypothetical protein